VTLTLDYHTDISGEYKMKINRTNLNELPRLLDEIHDRHFWIDEIVYDKNQCEWKLPFGERKKGPFNRTLRITGVTQFLCNDIAGTVSNSINKPIIDLDNHCIILDCNAPAEIKLSIQPDFEISVE
jgi:hypothetical protein